MYVLKQAFIFVDKRSTYMSTLYHSAVNKDKHNFTKGGIAFLVCIHQLAAQD